MASFTRRLRGNSSAWEARARRVRASFARFWDESRAQTLDLIDAPARTGDRTRAHQLLAVSLPDSPLAPAQAQAVVHACGRHLLTPYGLAADVASARGGSWTWLLPHFALAATRVHRNRAVGLSWLEPLAHFVADRRVGRAVRASGVGAAASRARDAERSVRGRRGAARVSRAGGRAAGPEAQGEHPGAITRRIRGARGSSGRLGGLGRRIPGGVATPHIHGNPEGRPPNPDAQVAETGFAPRSRSSSRIFVFTTSIATALCPPSGMMRSA